MSARAINTIGGIDANPHSGIQPWSKGDLFPAVFVVVETYSTDERAALLKTEHEVRLYGETERFDNYTDAVEWARAKIAARDAPARMTPAMEKTLRAQEFIRNTMLNGGYNA